MAHDKDGNPTWQIVEDIHDLDLFAPDQVALSEISKGHLTVLFTKFSVLQLRLSQLLVGGDQPIRMNVWQRVAYEAQAIAEKDPTDVFARYRAACLWNMVKYLQSEYETNEQFRKDPEWEAHMAKVEQEMAEMFGPAED